MIKTISLEMVELLPRVYGEGDYGVMIRNRDDEYSLYLYDTEDERDMSMAQWDQRTDVKAAGRYNIV